MSKCTQRGFPDLGQQFAERYLPPKIGTQYDHVHEKTDQFLQRQPAASRHRAAHQDLFLSGIAGQQGLERSHEYHEKRDALSPAKLVQGAVERFGKFHSTVLRRPRAPRWSRIIDRQFQDLRSIG